MGRGLALQVDERYPGIKETPSYTPKGSVVLYVDPGDNRYIFNLVTKIRHWEEPNYYTLSQCLHSLKHLIIKHQIYEIILPELGCGYDRLNEDSVSRMIFSVFQDVPVTVYQYFD